MEKEAQIWALGWFFLVLGLLTVLWNAVLLQWQYVVWFCNHALIIAGIALLKKNRFWLTAMLNWALIPVSLWVIDFLGKLFFDVYVFKVTDYLFNGQFWLQAISLQHLVTVPLLVYGIVLLKKPHPFAWAGTTAHGVVLLLISRVFIREDYNVLCAHQSCVPGIVPNGPYYLIAWVLVSLGVFVITNLFLVSVFRKPGVQARRPRQGRKQR